MVKFSLSSVSMQFFAILETCYDLIQTLLNGALAREKCNFFFSSETGLLNSSANEACPMSSFALFFNSYHTSRSV